MSSRISRSPPPGGPLARLRGVLDTTPYDDESARSYRSLRRGVGVLGLALPPVLLAGGLLTDHRVQNSISSYYYTDLRNVFVGTMWAIGLLLVFYRYAPRDNVVSSAAGLLALVVSLFPTTPTAPAATIRTPVDTAQRWVGGVHVAAALGFFLLLAVLSWSCFPLGEPSGGGGRPALRRRWYRWSAVVIGVSLAVAVLLVAVLGVADEDRLHPLFWCESIAVWAFASAWIVKSGWVLADRPAM